MRRYALPADVRRLCVWTIVLGQILDACTTAVAVMRDGIGAEANPLMTPILALPAGLAVLVLCRVVVCCALVICCTMVPPRSVATLGILGMALGAAVVVANNVLALA